ncbi:MAG: carboxypeptidase-like regulatory domain-containing protein [Oscillospiraceae bacterium]|nr:carboxypeptidase-like regulatory domain-containing protein [Oscillospiraceae bacterium]
MAYSTDSFDLNYSPPITITGGDDEEASLELTASSALPINLFGYIYSTTTGGSPIANAFVTLYDTSDNILDTTYADGSGYYEFSAITDGDYQVGASSPGFTPSDLEPVTIAGVPVQQDLILQPYSSDDRVIYGVITDSTTTDPIPGARIDIADTLTGEVIASTTSIGDGEYAVYDLYDGDFFVNVSASGYSAQNATAAISETVPFTEVDFALVSYTPPTEGGSINGYITDILTNPIDGAWVGLFAGSATPGTLIATTFADSTGYYTFNEIAPGEYVVKAKVQT